MKLGLISDTRGLLRPEAVAALRGCELINPGSAGARRFKLPVSVARLTIENGLIEVEIIPLA